MKAIGCGLVIPALVGLFAFWPRPGVTLEIGEFSAPPVETPTPRPTPQPSGGHKSQPPKPPCRSCAAGKDAPTRPKRQPKNESSARAPVSAPPPPMTKLYAAKAHCLMTGANGEGLALTPSKALEAAITDCRRVGGVPDCCRNGARPVTVPGYSAIAQCSLTGKTGAALGRRTAEQALNGAVASCVGFGGIEACCRVGAKLVRFATP
jgi:hypothetical protein